MKFKNPLAAAAAWAERMSDPEAAAQRKRQQSEERRTQEAEQPPIPEAAESAPEAAPEAAKTEKKPRQFGDEFRSAVWAGCIMLGVACSVVAFFIGMIR